MLRRTLAACLIAIGLFGAAKADSVPDDLTGLQSSVTTLLARPASNYIGQFTVATLPSCGTTAAFGSIAYVLDLGGGGNNAKCLNAGGVSAWTHFNYGIPGPISANSGTVPVTPLISPPIMQLTGTIGLATTLTLQLQTQNLYPGYDFYVIAPATVLGSIATTVQGVTGLNLSVLGGSTHHYSWNGTTLVTLQ